MPTALSKTQQERVARALVQEYGRTLGITLQAARNRVATGDWDDHPVAKRLLATSHPAEEGPADVPDGQRTLRRLARGGRQ